MTNLENQRGDISIERIRGVLEKELGISYRNFKLIGEGAQAYVFEADFGPEGNSTQRAIRVDRVEPVGERAKRNFGRGCDNQNNIRALSRLQDAEAHNIVGIIDYRQIPEEGLTISIHPKVKGETLEQSVLQKGPMNNEEIKGVFGEVLEAIRYCVENKELHRDVSPRNIMVQSNGISRGRGKLLDFASAAGIEDLEAKSIPTSGGTFVMDPLLDSRFTGEEKAYDVKSEMYSLASDLYFAATGRSMYRVSPDLGLFEDTRTRDSLLNPEGKIDFKKAEKSRKIALKEIKNRKLRRLIKKATSLDGLQRYQSIEEFEKDFERATDQGLLRKIVNAWKPITATLTLAGLIAGGTLFETYRNHMEEVESIQEETAKPLIRSEWNPDDVRISSNLFKLSYNIYPDKEYDNVVNERERKVLHVEPGRIIRGRISSRENPGLRKDFSSSYTLEGKVYIEGFPGEGITTTPLKFNTTEYDDWSPLGYDSGSEINLKVPEEISDGTHILAIEIYSPEKDREARDQLRLPPPGTILERVRIPIAVNRREKQNLDLTRIALSFQNYISFGVANEKERFEMIDRGLSYSFCLPEENFCDDRENPYNSNSAGFNISLPKVSDSRERILQISVHEGGKVVGNYFFPISQENIGGGEAGPFWWKLSVPDKSFSGRLEKYRNSSTQDRRN